MNGDSIEQDEINVSQEINVAALPLIVAEYTSLRSDILKLIELEQQLASGTILALGVFLTVGMQADKPVSILLLYPMIAAFLAAGWMHKDTRIRQIAKYILLLEAKTVNGKPVGLGWGHFLKAEREQSDAKRLMGLLSATGIFIGSQILVVVLAYLRGVFLPLDRMLLWLDIVSVIVTSLILSRSVGWNKVSDVETDEEEKWLREP